MLDQYYNLLDNNAKACYKFAENSLKKNGIKIICDERLFDQPLYQTIDGLSEIIAIKLHNSKNEVKKDIEQLKEYNKNIGTIYYYLSRGFPSVFLVQLYIDGKYVHQDYHQAKGILENLLKYLLYSQSAETKYLLGTMYQQGLGMKKNMQNKLFALSWYH